MSAKLPRNRATKRGHYICYSCRGRINANAPKKRRSQSLDGKSETTFNVVYHTPCFKAAFPTYKGRRRVVA